MCVPEHIVTIFMKTLGFFQQHKCHLVVPLSPSGLSLRPGAHPWRLSFSLPTPTLLPTPSSLCSPRDRSINRETRCWGKEGDFIRKASSLRRWRTRVPKIPSYRGLDASSFYRIRREVEQKGRIVRERQGGSKVKRAISLAKHLLE